MSVEPIGAACGTPPNIATPKSPSAVVSDNIVNFLQQLENVGIQVDISDLELLPKAKLSDPVVTSTNNPSGKRKRTDSGETNQQRKRSDVFQPTLENAADSLESNQPTSLQISIEPIHPKSSPVPAQTLSPKIVAAYSIPVSESTRGVKKKSKSSSNTDSPNSTNRPASQSNLSSESLTSSQSQNQTNQTQPENRHPSSLQTTKENVNVQSCLTIPESTSLGSSVRKNSETIGTQPDTPETLDSNLNVPNKNIADSLDSPKEPTDLLFCDVNNLNDSTDANLGLPEDQSLPLVSAPSSELIQDPEDMVDLECHKTLVRSLFVNGPCIFSSSLDGTVHVYDMATKNLSMRILGHQKPVTWLYAVSLNVPSATLRTITSTSDYLTHLSLITGSEDNHIRQFSLSTGKLTHEVKCSQPVTCVAGSRSLGKLYIGAKKGFVYMYNPKNNWLDTAPFQVFVDYFNTIFPIENESLLFAL